MVNLRHIRYNFSVMDNKPYKVIWLTLATIPVLMATPATANEPTDLVISPLSSIYACAELLDDTQRLACFDTHVPALRVKEQKKEIVAVDAESVKAIKREAFGFSLPSLPKLGIGIWSGEKQEKSKDILVTAVKSIRRANNRYIIHLDNGQIWRQVNGDLKYVPKGKLEATIKPASLNTYYLSLSNGKDRVRGLGIKRIE